MSGGKQTPFDIEAVRALVGDRAFARGEAYHRDGLVEILGRGPDRVLAQVAGTEDYRTILTHGGGFDGECSCPAFAQYGSCKHMAAVALAANDAAEADPDEAQDAMARLRAHLAAKPADALIDMILEVAERDPALFRRLDTAAVVAQSDEATIERRLRKEIDRATHLRELLDYREASQWAAGVEAVLDSLDDLAAGPRAELVLRLAGHALSRIMDAAPSMDDSDGDCGAALDRARDIHLAACRAVRPDPVPLARDLFAREMADDHDTFYRSAETYADVLGEAGLAEFRRLVTEAWNALPARAADGRTLPHPPLDYYRLKGMLDFFAERDGDVDARIALRSKDLSSPSSYRDLAEFCRDHGREAEALRWAEEGLWMFEDGEPDIELVLLAADLLAKTGRTDDAVARLRTAFERSPSLRYYERLVALGGGPARERALVHLEKRLSEGGYTRWDSPADLLVRILINEKVFDRAWAVVRDHQVTASLLEALAMASESAHPDEAVAVYAARVEDLARRGGNGNYEAAVGLVARMVPLRDPAGQEAYVADLKERHKRKRNFMKLLG